MISWSRWIAEYTRNITKVPSIKIVFPAYRIRSVYGKAKRLDFRVTAAVNLCYQNRESGGPMVLSFRVLKSAPTGYPVYQNERVPSMSEISKKKDIWTIALVAAVILLSVETAYLINQNRKLKAIIENPTEQFKTLSTGDDVPPVTAQDINGNRIDLEYSPDAPYTVIFWFSTSCSSCEENIEFWKEMFLDYGSAKTRFIGLSVGSAEETAEFASENDIQFPIILAREYGLVEEYMGNIVPQTILINPAGIVAQVWPGPLSHKKRAEVLSSLKGIQPGNKD
jgi:peroxiredoxin